MQTFNADNGDDGAVTLKQLRAQLISSLTDAGIETAEADTEWIICEVLSLSRGALRLPTTLEAPVSAIFEGRIRAHAADRATRKPLQYVLGSAPFRNLELSVGEGVFIPRPETEWVTQLGIDALCRRDPLRNSISQPTGQGAHGLRQQEGQPLDPLVLELCTGSGAIALAIATETDSLVWTYEKSVAAARWAAKNIAKYPTGRVQLVREDIAQLLHTPQLPALGGTQPQPGSIDLVITNPPYVPSGEIPEQPEVRDYDPEMALYSGADGLDLIRTIAVIAARWLRPGGAVVIEHTERQGSRVREILQQAGLMDPHTHRDLTNRERASTAHKPAD